jgi:hypothetical protein
MEPWCGPVQHMMTNTKSGATVTRLLLQATTDSHWLPVATCQESPEAASTLRRPVKNRCLKATTPYSSVIRMQDAHRLEKCSQDVQVQTLHHSNKHAVTTDTASSTAGWGCRAAQHQQAIQQHTRFTPQYSGSTQRLPPPQGAHDAHCTQGSMLHRACMGTALAWARMQLEGTTHS